MQKFIFKLGLFILLNILFNSCYKEFIILPEHKNNIFNFILSPNTETEILEARNRKFDILPTPYLYYGELQYSVDKARVRGKSATNFQRKSYSLNLTDFIVFKDFTETHREFEKFKLIALCQDYTYIENRIAHKFLGELNLWPLHSFYTEVMLNNHHQGLYLFIEDPEENCFQLNKAEVVIRRSYRGEIDKMEFNTALATKDSTQYAKLFTSIYEILPKHKGKELFDILSKKINLQNYMRKIAFDYLVKNGDYTDEIYFFGKTQNDGNFCFDIIPWDYDDLFSSQPHEIWHDDVVGNRLGTRAYKNNNDVLGVIGERLIYSIEDDIDYLIATDNYLYQKYLNEVQFMLKIITTSKVEEIFNSVHDELLSFYDKPEIIEQSKFDEDSTSLELMEKNILEKSEFVKKRILFMQNELNKQLIN